MILSASSSLSLPPYGDIMSLLILLVLDEDFTTQCNCLCCNLSFTLFCTAILNLLHFLYRMIINQQLSDLLSELLVGYY